MTFETEFETMKIVADGVGITVRVAGTGPPLLLLHGYPQTGYMWHKVAPLLAQKHQVVIADLRGYGDSDKPSTSNDHAVYSKRAMANDMITVMKTLGHAQFNLAGHDRGGRVAHRLARDHPNAVNKLAVLDIAPTLMMYQTTDKEFATKYYHWFFLIQPSPLPENMIGNDSKFFLEHKLQHWGKNRDAITTKAFAEYLRCFSNPATIHATCEDYRAAASIDLKHDAIDQEIKLTMPVLALWGEEGMVGNKYDVVESWRCIANNVCGNSVPGGHFLAEESPNETFTALSEFFTK